MRRKSRHIHRLAEQLIERLAAGILQHERNSIPITDSAIGRAAQRESSAVRNAYSCGNRSTARMADRSPSGATKRIEIQTVRTAPVESELAFLQNRELITGKLDHRRGSGCRLVICASRRQLV